MSIYLIGAWFYVFKRRPISKGGGSAFSRSPFPNLIIFNKPHYATSGRTVSRSVELRCVLVCVSGSGALSLSRRLETVRPRPAGVPMSSAHVRIGGENPLFPASELEWTWDNCGRDREGERKERASSPSPSTHKHDGTTRPLINARVSSVQVSTGIFCLDQQLWTWCSSGFRGGITVDQELFQVSALFLIGSEWTI